MDIQNMHITFRQLAQQMGMQNVRAILPAQIDVLLNTAISDIVNQLVRENVGLSNNDGHTDMFKIGQTDALRTLQRDESLVVSEEYEQTKIYFVPKDLLYLTNVYVKYSLQGSDRVFPMRLVDSAYYANAMTDSVLKPTYKSPIAVYTNEKVVVDFGYKGINEHFINPKAIANYIKTPNTVKLALNTEEESIDCDLPESLHETVVKYAVDLYRRSVRGEYYSGNRNQSQQPTE